MKQMIKLNPFTATDRSFIHVSGSDAAEFLQGQISNDIDLLTRQPAIHALILTPQGKILADLFAYNYQNGYLLDVHSSIADWLLKRFNMFKLRSDVVFDDQTDRFNLIISSTPIENAELCAADPRLDNLIRNISQTQTDNQDSTQYNQYLAAQAIIEFGTNYQASEHFPQDLWFDKLGSVSFTKGCYVGQEVVSRMRHKSDARKRLLPLSTTKHYEKGDKINLNEKSVGQVVCQIGNIVLGMMRVDKLENNQTKLDDFEIKRPNWILNL